MPQFSGSWDLDIWGKVRRQIESNTSAAQASAADLDNAKLLAQGALATAYFNLRAADALSELLDRTVKEYKTTLEIVQNQFNSGDAVSKADVATAEAQVGLVSLARRSIGREGWRRPRRGFPARAARPRGGRPCRGWP